MNPTAALTAAPALSGPLAKASVIALALLAAIALLTRERRARALATLALLVLAPVVLLADIWHSQQLALVHRHPLLAAAVGAVAVAAAVGAALAIVRRPWLIGPLIIVALPFRIPIKAGGITSNLLVPLYFVVAAGTLASVWRGLRGEEGPAEPADMGRAAQWVARLLALYVVLYALQATYSDPVGFQKALQQVVFFYVPFALAYNALRDVEWNSRLVRLTLMLVAALAMAFAAVGFVEFATKTVFLNPKLVVQNGVHAYFTVNSVFFDPDIFGRFLALVMILLAAVLIYDRRQRVALGVTAVLAILWAGLVLTLSRSSIGALLVGLGALAALRWRVSRAVWAAAAVVALGAAVVAISPKTFGLNQGLNGASSGRAGLISGGAKLFAQRPVWGYGSGSFESEYKRQHPLAGQNLSASHTIPITVAAEQGVIGEVAYAALVLASLAMLFRRARDDPMRAAIAAAFLALVFHTMLYADFLEDPVTWTLLGIGTALAGSPRPPRLPSIEPREPAPATV